MPRLRAAVVCLAACGPGGPQTTADPSATDTDTSERTSTSSSTTTTPTTASSATTTGPTTPPVDGHWRGMVHPAFGWGPYFEDCESGETWPVQNLPISGICEHDTLMLEIEGTLVVDAPDFPGTSLIVTTFVAGPCVEGSCDEPWSVCHDLDVACEKLPDCDPFEQTCPEGQKCAPFDSPLGDDHWDNTRCVPVAPNPKQPGEPCTAPDGPKAGIDDCAEGSLCWDVDPDTLLGTCFAHCVGTYEMPTCADPTEQCVIAYSNSLTLCLPACDPLDIDCPPGDTCLLVDWESTFVCVPDASGTDAQAFDPCEQQIECAPGLLCANPALAAECDPNAAGGCCLPFCDLDMSQCPGAGQECLPWFEGDAPAGLEDLGVCGIPF